MHNYFQIGLATPEILLLLMTCGLLLLDAFIKPSQRQLSFLFSLAILALLTVVTLLQWLVGGLHGKTFHGLYVVDPLSHFLKLLSYIAVFLTLLYGRLYAEKRDMLARGGEIFVLTLLALLGQMVMISAGSMLTIYLGLELMSFSLYALVAVRRENALATEAAMKFFLLGALASAVLLYGMSMIYGATGHLDLQEIAAVIRAGEAGRLPLVFGVVFIVAGLAFKLTAAPFHMWTPDVYHGAPTAVTLVIGAAPKFAGLVIMLRLLIEGLHGVALDWQPMLMILAVLSLAIGNIAAIAQTNFKRMLAYSTISHMGFVFLALMSGVAEGQPVASGLAYGSALFYVVTYVLTTLCTFGLILVMSRKGFECEEIADFKGLNRRDPVLAGVLLLSMFSLAGVPPLVGFYAKLAVLQALVAAGHVWLAVVAVLFSLVGAFYYLRVVKMAYFDEAVEDAVALAPPVVPRGVISVNGMLLLVLGVLPGGLMALCVHVIQRSLVF
ncbi:MAG: NADH-quinone oxidoreductase subunit NuoN [Castellaniella sp.]